ncbi:MAG: MDR family MFS transporter [Chloroflexota bacterium]
MFNRFQQIYREFPSRFWLVVGVMFIDRIGGTMLFPFFSLYITQKFEVGMTQAGIILGFFSIFGMVGSMIGGALTDKFGRRSLILFGLVFSAVTTLAFGLVEEFNMLFPLAVITGLLSDIAGPAHQAMIADILPEEQRAEGFGILRVVANMSWIIGPTIGGFIATRSFLYLFIIDAVISCIVAVLFYLMIAETKPEAHAETEAQSVLQTFAGYGAVLRDFAYMAFILASILMLLAYQQMYSTLSVYLRDNHGISPQEYGFLMSTSAITVILFQFWVTRRIRHRPPFLMMAFGSLFYMLGFGLFGFVAAFWLFALNIVIVTIGEMIVVPTSQALAANFAPAEMRGRYMAVFGTSWAIPAIFGPAAAGMILDNLNPNLLWYLAGMLCAVAALGYYALHARLGKQKRFAPAPPGQEPVAA